MLQLLNNLRNKGIIFLMISRLNRFFRKFIYSLFAYLQYLQYLQYCNLNPLVKISNAFLFRHIINIHLRIEYSKIFIF